MSQSSNRVLPLDGLRCVAALGVVWVHVWAAWKNPALKIFHVDLYKAIALVGNGVDLFFVISGFCMYLMYGSKDFNVDSFKNFIKKRWLRIAPPYYAAVLVYALVLFGYYGQVFPFFKTVMLHFLFLQNFNGVYELSAPFWSLAAEWYFYLILPFLLLGIKKVGFGKTILAFSIVSLICGFVFYYQNHLGWTKDIWVRLIEFLWGIVAARLYTLKQLNVLKPFNKWWLGVLVAYIGRLFILTEVVEHFGSYGVIFKTLGLPVMTLGFALFIAYLLEYQSSVVGRFFSSKIMVYLGKISYSIYLWHSLILVFMFPFLSSLLQSFGAFSPIIAFVVIGLMTILTSIVSYKLFEEPYLKKSKKTLVIS
jgi:peptidoglycan/LPS O-acetylase OafA/YrhL